MDAWIERAWEEGIEGWMEGGSCDLPIERERSRQPLSQAYHVLVIAFLPLQPRVLRCAGDLSPIAHKNQEAIQKRLHKASGDQPRKEAIQSRRIALPPLKGKHSSERKRDKNVSHTYEENRNESGEVSTQRKGSVSCRCCACRGIHVCVCVCNELTS